MRVTVFECEIAIRSLAMLTRMEEMQTEVERTKKAEQYFKEAEASLNKMFSGLAITSPEKTSLLEKSRNLIGLSLS